MTISQCTAEMLGSAMTFSSGNRPLNTQATELLLLGGYDEAMLSVIVEHLERVISNGLPIPELSPADENGICAVWWGPTFSLSLEFDWPATFARLRGIGVELEGFEERYEITEMEKIGERLRVFLPPLN
jgi:hypothetical protein